MSRSPAKIARVAGPERIGERVLELDDDVDEPLLLVGEPLKLVVLLADRLRLGPAGVGEPFVSVGDTIDRGLLVQACTTEVEDQLRELEFVTRTRLPANLAAADRLDQTLGPEADVGELLEQAIQRRIGELGLLAELPERQLGLLDAEARLLAGQLGLGDAADSVLSGFGGGRLGLEGVLVSLRAVGGVVLRRLDGFEDLREPGHRRDRDKNHGPERARQRDTEDADTGRGCQERRAQCDYRPGQHDHGIDQKDADDRDQDQEYRAQGGRADADLRQQQPEVADDRDAAASSADEQAECLRRRGNAAGDGASTSQARAGQTPPIDINVDVNAAPVEPVQLGLDLLDLRDGPADRDFDLRRPSAWLLQVARGCCRSRSSLTCAARVCRSTFASPTSGRTPASRSSRTRSCAPPRRC